jgi:hypothetical protein
MEHGEHKVVVHVHEGHSTIEKDHFVMWMMNSHVKVRVKSLHK